MARTTSGRTGFARISRLAGWAGLLVLPVSANAALVDMQATLTGAQVVPPSASPATGSATITVDTNLNSMVYEITYTGLQSAETSALIHGFAPPGMNAGTKHVLPLGSPKIGTWIFAEADEASILAGLTYVNIHTAQRPLGEIRGQIVRALPRAGRDCFQSTMSMQIQIGAAASITLSASGPAKVQRSQPVAMGGSQSAVAEITDLALTGTHAGLGGAFTITESALYRSDGLVQSPPGIAFPAASFFDPWFEIVTGTATYFARNPLRLSATIDALPPTGETYTGGDVLLYRHGTSEGTVAGRILAVTWQPGSALECLPPAGTDGLETELHLQMTLTGIGVEHIIGLGPMLLNRFPEIDEGDGRPRVPLEIQSLDLSGTGPLFGAVQVVLDPMAASTGNAKSVSSSALFPMDFELGAFLEFRMPALGRTLVPQNTAALMHATVTTLPPLGFPLDAGNVPVTLVDKMTGQPAGTLDFFYLVPNTVFEWAPAPAGIDCFDVTGSATVELFGFGTGTVPLGGPAMVARGTPAGSGGAALGLPTELRHLRLTGSAAPVGAVTLAENPSLASLGQISSDQPGALLPAHASFDVFLQIETAAAGVLRPDGPVQVRTAGLVTGVPTPAGTIYTLQFGPVDLENTSGVTRGRLHAWTFTTGAATEWVTDAGEPGDETLGALLAGAHSGPNPFRDRLRITLRLDRTRHVGLEVFDVRGARVRRIDARRHSAGLNRIEWDGKDALGNPVATGLYVYRLTVDGQAIRRKVLRVR